MAKLYTNSNSTTLVIKELTDLLEAVRNLSEEKAVRFIRQRIDGEGRLVVCNSSIISDMLEDNDNE